MMITLVFSDHDTKVEIFFLSIINRLVTRVSSTLARHEVLWEKVLVLTLVVAWNSSTFDTLAGCFGCAYSSAIVSFKPNHARSLG